MITDQLRMAAAKIEAAGSGWYCHCCAAEVDATSGEQCVSCGEALLEQDPARVIELLRAAATELERLRRRDVPWSYCPCCGVAAPRPGLHEGCPMAGEERQ